MDIENSIGHVLTIGLFIFNIISSLISNLYSKDRKELEKVQLKLDKSSEDIVKMREQLAKMETYLELGKRKSKHDI